METKTCSKCKENKDITAFHISQSCPGGRRARCAECVNAEARLKAIPLEEREKRKLAEYIKFQNKLKQQTDGVKICIHCKEIKNIDLFGNLKSQKDGKCSSCKECRSKYNSNYKSDPEYKEKTRQYYFENKEFYQNYHKEWAKKNQDEIRRKSKEYRDNPLRKERERAQKKEYRSRPEVRQQRREYAQKRNKEKRDQLNAYRRQWEQQKKKTDPQFALACRIKTRIRTGFVRSFVRKTRKSSEYLGCTWAEFKIHIENLFCDGMTWDHFFRQEIHLDHIRPISDFDLSNDEEARKCFHFSNLQPLWGEDNLDKSDKLDWVKPSIESPYN